MKNTRDVIFVLSRGIEKSGRLPVQAQARADKAVELFRDGVAPNILFTGRWSYKAASAFPKTEAQAMAEYAMAHDVPKEATFTETESVDTLTNFLFSKKIFEEHDWQNICIVTSSDHRERTEYLARKVLGPKYVVDIVACDDRLGSDELARQIVREKKSLQIVKEYLDKYEDGDDAAIWEFVKSSHPAFTDTPLVSQEELMQKMGEDESDYE